MGDGIRGAGGAATGPAGGGAAGAARGGDPGAHVPTSVLLEALFRGEGGSGETVTLDWLMRGLGSRSFGVVLLLLALLAALPAVSVVAGVLLVVPAWQMLRARPAPVFPRAIATRPIAARRLARLVRRVVPVLRAMERVVRPRWATPFEATKRVVGGAVLLIGAGLFVPVPLSNVPPAAVIALIAFAYLERDGALLTVALAGALGVAAVVAGVAWQALSVTGWVPGLL